MICWLVSIYRVFEITYCLRLWVKGNWELFSSPRRGLGHFGPKDEDTKFLRNVGNFMPVATACYPESYNLLKWYYPAEQTWRSSDVSHPVFCSFSCCPDWRIARFFLAHLVKFRNVILNQAVIILAIHSANSAPTAYTENIYTIDWNVLSLIYSNVLVAVSRFCAARWVVIICFPCYFIITRFIFLQRSFYALFSCFVC